MYLLIPLSPSRILKAFYAAQCGLVLVAMILASPPLWLHWFSAMCFLASVLLRITRESPTGLNVSDAEIQLSFKDRSVPVRLHRTFFCNPYLIVLRLAQMSVPTDNKNRLRKRRHFDLVLLPDSCPKRLHRQLRTVLCWYRFDTHVVLR